MKNPYEPILKEIAAGLLETAETKPNFSNDAFMDALLIFQTVFMDKIYECQDYDGRSIEHRANMAMVAGKELKKLIHNFTGLDTIKLVENYGQNKD